MMKSIKYLIALLLSVNALSQNGRNATEVISTWQNERTSILLAQGLIACDIMKEDNKILAKTIDQQYLMIDVAKDKVKDAEHEIQKRDDIIDRKDFEYEQLEQMNSQLKNDIKKERRKKAGNKWLYTGIGIGIGIITGKVITR